MPGRSVRTGRIGGGEHAPFGGGSGRSRSRCDNRSGWIDFRDDAAGSGNNPLDIAVLEPAHAVPGVVAGEGGLQGGLVISRLTLPVIHHQQPPRRAE